MRGAPLLLPFEFVVFDTPRSQGSSNAQRGGIWQTQVANAAAARWGAQPPVSDAIAVSITFLYDPLKPAGQRPDIDNIAKPILDALQGLVYGNDKNVSDILCRKRSLGADPEIRNASALLLNALGRNDDSVHVMVDDPPIREVHL